MICIYWRRLKRLTAAWTTSHYFSNVAMDIYLFTTAQGDRLQRLDHSRCSLHEFVSRWIVDKQSFFFYLDASNHMSFHFYKMLGHCCFRPNYKAIWWRLKYNAPWVGKRTTIPSVITMYLMADSYPLTQFEKPC